MPLQGHNRPAPSTGKAAHKYPAQCRAVHIMKEKRTLWKYSGRDNLCDFLLMSVSEAVVEVKKDGPKLVQKLSSAHKLGKPAQQNPRG